MEIKKPSITGFLLLCLFLPKLLAGSSFDDFQLSKAKAEAEVELGIDSFERRFYRPKLQFHFPLKSNLLFFKIMYYQRINSRLQGEVDFWLKVGLKRALADNLILEASLNHMCRHISSAVYSNVLDVNELVGRLWLYKKNYRLGFGLGTYLGGSDSYKSLLLLNFEFQRILKSEFSLVGEVKLVNLNEILHEIELSAALSKSVELFIRNTRHYEYKNTTYLGIRLKSDGKAENYIEHLRFRWGYYPFDDTYKALAAKEIKLEFFKTPHRRVLFSFRGIIPVLESDGLFIGVFNPEKLRYPLSVEYEKKAGDKLFVYGYWRYDVVMPIDVAKEFSSNLGVGIGLRNQPNFNMISKKLRFEFLGGYNFTHKYDAGGAVGLNTLNKSFNIGAELHFRINPDQLKEEFELFIEVGRGVKIRPFVRLERRHYFNLEDHSDNKILFGIQFIKWF
jgi:hypothetical protein